MIPETWTVNPIRPEYLVTAPLSYQPSLPYAAPPTNCLMPMAYRTCGDLPTVGGFDWSDNFTAPGGVHLGLPLSTYPFGYGKQTWTSSHISPWYPFQPANDVPRSPIYQGSCSGSQGPTFLGQVAPASAPTQHLAVKCPIDAGYKPSSCFQFGHTVHVRPSVINWSNNRAVSAEIKKLKRVWKEGVGIKRQKRIKNRNYSYCTNGMGNSNVEIEETGQTWNKANLNLVQPSVDKISEQHEDNFGQEDISKTRLSSPPGLGDLEFTDRLDKLIAELEEFQKIVLLPSPEATPTPTKLSLKTKVDDSPIKSTPTPTKLSLRNKVDDSHTKTTPSPHRPLRFSPPLKSAKTRTSLLPAKEIPTLRRKANSAAATRRVSSLRPPKTIARSSKLVTQPVPFKVAGESVSRNLKLKGGQRYQSAGDKA